jgi:hypothetical protein
MVSVYTSYGRGPKEVSSNRFHLIIQPPHVDIIVSEIVGLADFAKCLVGQMAA